LVVILLIEELGGGGKERRLIELIKGLSNFGDFQLHLVLTKRNSDYLDLIGLPVEIHYLQGFSNISITFEYYKLILSIQPNVIHTWSLKSSFYISLLKPFFDFSFIVGFIGDTFGFSRLGLFVAHKIIFPAADFVVSNSKAGLLAYKVPITKGRVIYNGFDSKRISKNKENKLESLGIQSAIKVVMLANVTHNKNYQLFIQVAENLLARYNQVCFISIGKVLPEFKEMTEPYFGGKHPRISFLGFRSDVSDLIKYCDIGLLCTYSEGISNAIIELMANGIPVITNDMFGGSKELITNGLDGIICQDIDIVRNLEYLIEKEEARKFLSKNSVSKIVSLFSIENMISSYIRLYSASSNKSYI